MLNYVRNTLKKWFSSQSQATRVESRPEVNQPSIVVDFGKDIIDASDIRPSKIKRPRTKYADVKRHRNIYYDHEPLQIKTESAKLADKIVSFLDTKVEEKELAVDSLYRMERSLESVQLYAYQKVQGNYRQRLLYGGSERIILLDYFSREIVDQIDQLIEQTIQQLPLPSRETQLYYNLTPNGLTKVWWDDKGEIRETKILDDETIKFLNLAEVRNNKAWDDFLFRKEILIEYQGLVNQLKVLLELPNNQSIKKNAYLIDYFAGKMDGNVATNRVSSSLLVFAEGIVRKRHKSLPSININKFWDYLKKYISSGIYQDFKVHVTLLINPPKKVAKEKQPLRRKIDLNLDKIELSRQENQAVVSLVADYMAQSEELQNKDNVFQNGFSEISEIIEESHTSKGDKVAETINLEPIQGEIQLKKKAPQESNLFIDFTTDQVSFIQLLLEENSLDNQEAKMFVMQRGAFLNNYVSDINQLLYDEVEDTVIIIDDKAVYINEDYRDLVKGVVDSGA